ncbi:MAG: hypothetical protein RR646_00810 [Erysipelotrichaceae bacterium]
MTLLNAMPYKKYLIIKLNDTYDNLIIYNKYGIYINSIIMFLYNAPFNGPYAFLISNSIIVLRTSELVKIEVIPYEV